MHLLWIRVLGEFSATDHRGDSLSVGSRRTQALVSYLALSIESGGTRSELATLLGEEGPGEAVADLRYALRFLPADILIVEDEAIRFNPAVVSVDAERFERLATRGSLHAIGEAVDLYAGNLLEGYESGYPALDQWIRERRLHYWQVAVAALGKLLAAQVRAGWWQRAAETAGRLLTLDPTQELVHRTLMRLQLEQGRPDSALRRYQECVDVLRREFGRSPSPETERVHQEIVAALERSPAPREALTLRPDRPVLILLLEDDAVSCALIEGFLAEAGYEVVTVGDGGDALMEIGRRTYDVLILDINVPTLSGLQLFEIMIRKGITTPAIFISGTAGAEAEAKSLEMGAADFLRKPIRKDVLLPRIRTILQRRSRIPGVTNSNGN